MYVGMKPSSHGKLGFRKKINNTKKGGAYASYFDLDFATSLLSTDDENRFVL